MHGGRNVPVSSASSSSRRIALYALATAVAVAVSGLGIAAGLGSQVLKGGAETGAGSDVTQHGLAYWGWSSTVIGTMPTPVPRVVSTTVGAPTRLARLAGASYSINAGTAGQTSVVWTFTEVTTAPRSTELMVTFVDGLTGAASTIVAYLETSARAPVAALTFVFYWDAGAVAPTGLEIATMTVTVQACTAIGVCP
jgi:hypothetical protein